MRHHLSKYEVQEIYSFPAQSIERKQLLSKLRKKGNYINNTIKCVRPVKKSKTGIPTEYLPCPTCLGFYSRKLIWRHRKVCDKNNSTTKAQVESQNFLVKNLNVDKQLQNEVFPIMRPDKISLVAKKDWLICAFGTHYIRKHTRKTFLTVASRKMRELAKILLEMQKLQPSIKDLRDALKPQNYDLIVAATKHVSGYDERNEHFSSPNLAMNISTSFKQCCRIALMDALKSKSCVDREQLEDDLKKVNCLFEDNWRVDIFRQAADSLYTKKFIKVNLVPLAKDLKLLNDYLCKNANDLGTKLSTPNRRYVDTYNELLESVYCRLILFNRNYSKEFSKILLNTYDNAESSEQFGTTLSITEHILHKSCKIISLTSRNARVRYFFSKGIQNDINILKSVRNIHVPKENEYLFGRAGCTSHLGGYRVLEKKAKLCGIKNPSFLSSIKMRKYIGTLTQIFSMSDEDIGELAAHIGLVGTVQKLQDNVPQTAKMTKLLLLIESGDVNLYKGKTLDDIKLNMEEEVLEPPELVGQDVVPDEKSEQESIQIKYLRPQEETNVDPPVRKRRRLVPWTQQQKMVVMKFFDRHIEMMKAPKRHECDELKQQYPDVLENKDWLKIKVFVQNVYTKKHLHRKYSDDDF